LQEKNRKKQKNFEERLKRAPIFKNQLISVVLEIRKVVIVENEILRPGLRMIAR